MTKVCCGTCLFSRWYLTEKGRIKKDCAGRCIVEIPIPILPASVLRFEGFRKSYMRKEDGQDCPLWQENFGKPISE